MREQVRNSRFTEEITTNTKNIDTKSSTAPIFPIKNSENYYIYFFLSVLISSNIQFIKSNFIFKNSVFIQSKVDLFSSN